MNMQPRNLRSTVTTMQGNEGSTKPATPCRPSEAAQNKSGIKRSTSAKKGRGVPSTAQAPEVSDSSSNDGIEEAIQLYQLQKTRKKANGDSSQRAQFREERQPDPPAHRTSSATKSTLPETHRKTPSKKKPVAAKTTDPGPGGLDTAHFPTLPNETKALHPVSPASRSEFVERSLCRADTSAKLMCAEAILDISKMILHPPPPTPPVEGSDGFLSASPLFSANMPSRSDGDSGSVDSDDSIEQEIKSGRFWPSRRSRGVCWPKPREAIRAQENTGGGERKTGARLPTTARVERSGHEGRDLPVQGKVSEAPGGEGAARLSQGQDKTDKARRLAEKESSEDKSSSLDSDDGHGHQGLVKVQAEAQEVVQGAQGSLQEESQVQHHADALGAAGRARERLGGQEAASAQELPLQVQERRWNPFPRESQVSALSPGSLSDDSSSVDSDDSIELEIRKFLAEKAKESVSSSEVQAEGPATLGTGGPARPEVLGRKEPAPPPGMCTRSQRARGVPQPAEGSRGTESSGVQGAAGLFDQGRKGLPLLPA
ncbi:hypothetical protein P7K49_012320 [Saguinus oedipus]|uniref:Protein phosphatase 1 regulatory subunit 26 N-terminal domain-containing protein n=1 Tax=Saguinus oedipus TaxID=9490 RepID=A0ABQ9VT58_SAGOE|nr:hypothetical protein P7K49_012320 [Saguinus oedipus]